MKQSGASETTQPVAFAIAYLALDDNSKALDLLERAEAKRDNRLLTAASPLDDPTYAPIRDNPRFIRILQKMDLWRFKRPER